MKKPKIEPRIRMQTKLSVDAMNTTWVDMKPLVINSHNNLFGMDIGKHFGLETRIAKRADGGAELQSELWVFTPETLLELLQSNDQELERFKTHIHGVVRERGIDLLDRITEKI